MRHKRASRKFILPQPKRTQTMKTVIKIVFASAITLSAAAPAAYAQNIGWGNASTPGASVDKDDQSPTTLKKHHVFYTTSRSRSQTTDYGNASAPGASVEKDDTTVSER
jgi:hypothetical protein